MASIIDQELAKELIAAYREQNASADGTRLLTNQGHFLNGFFIDRASLDSILANPDVAGISIHLARHPEFPKGDKRIFTIIFGGATPNPDYIEGGKAARYLNAQHVWDQVEPCPPVCANIL